MTKLHFVNKARKDNSVAKAGESYYWWQFAFAPKMYSKEQPSRSRLTRSEFLSTYWDIEDSLLQSYDEDSAQELISQLEELRDMCQDNLDNMPDQLQDSESGQLLQERIDGLDDWIGEIESIDWEDEEMDGGAAADLIQSSNPGL